jgi:hypothetical protein
MPDSLSSAYADILAHPEPDAPRLRYAELVGGDHARFIREGISLRDDRRSAVFVGGSRPSKARLANLFERHPEWGMDVRPLVDAFDFGRGFVEQVTLTAQAFLERAESLFAKAPVLHAQLTKAAGQCAALAASPHLARLRSLDLMLNRLEDADAIALAASPHLRELRWLELSKNSIDAAGVDALAAATNLRVPGLQYLGLGLNRCVDPTDEAWQDENGVFNYSSRPHGSALEAKYGRLPWVHFRSEHVYPDPDVFYRSK